MNNREAKVGTGPTSQGTSQEVIVVVQAGDDDDFDWETAAIDVEMQTDLDYIWRQK